MSMVQSGHRLLESMIQTGDRESPCINVCTVVDGVCVGCFRTEKQIEEWLHYTDEERRKIMEECETKMYQTQ